MWQIAQGDSECLRMRTRILPLLLALHILLEEFLLRAFFGRICLVSTAGYFFDTCFGEFLSVLLFEFINVLYTEQSGQDILRERFASSCNAVPFGELVAEYTDVAGNGVLVNLNTDLLELPLNCFRRILSCQDQTQIYDRFAVQTVLVE